jgi:hypothetical protein
MSLPTANNVGTNLPTGTLPQSRRSVGRSSTVAQLPSCSPSTESTRGQRVRCVRAVCGRVTDSSHESRHWQPGVPQHSRGPLRSGARASKHWRTQCGRLLRCCGVGIRAHVSTQTMQPSCSWTMRRSHSAQRRTCHRISENCRRFCALTAAVSGGCTSRRVARQRRSPSPSARGWRR